MKSFFKLAALVAAFGFAFAFAGCSNGGDDNGALLAVTSGGGSGGTDNGTQPGGGTNPTPAPTPTPAATYTITFNANDGSENPATATQTFTEGVSQTLKTIAELGFSKNGFNFAGWGTTSDASESSYADGASYTACSNTTLYALWSSVPIYSVNTPVNANGSVTATPATAAAGTEITLSNTPKAGYSFISYTVTDADGVAVTVTDGKFTMPEKNVTVTAMFTAITYTITFNANDGSQTPATATQEFTAGIPQALKTISELGFSKNGFNFAGWATTASESESSYADGASYTATATTTLYALWSFIPVYGMAFTSNLNGSVTASPMGGTAGTEITLSNTPKPGYKCISYTVTDADGATVTVTDGKFKMPAKNVIVTATFKAINYNVTCGPFTNGSVTASSASATFGKNITLTASPASGYKLTVLTVTADDGTSVTVSGTGNTRTFSMPAKNVTVTALFSAINYTVTCGSCVNGSVSASSAISTVGQTVTLTINPATGYRLAALAVTAEGGPSVTVNGTGNTRTFTMPAFNVTVSATFISLAQASGEYTKVDTVNINGTTYDLVTFGLWPQTIIASGVTVDTNVTETHGAFTYCKGSDDEWYVKQSENAYGSGYMYSDRTTVAQSSDNSSKWFKVEPIKWRVLTTNYSGDKLLLAESILTSGLAYYLNKSSRSIGGSAVYSNNYKYSTIRSWLNGSYEADDTQVTAYAEKGFLQTAFTSTQQSAIKTTTVDNSAESTTDVAGFLKQASNYKCDNTCDKIFLLSMKEVTTIEYGFVGDDSTRIRAATDFAKAAGVYFVAGTNGTGFLWWLRSPSYEANRARSVSYNGNTATSINVDVSYNGVVPALCVGN